MAPGTSQLPLAATVESYAPLIAIVAAVAVAALIIFILNKLKGQH